MFSNEVRLMIAVALLGCGKPAADTPATDTPAASSTRADSARRDSTPPDTARGVRAPGIPVLVGVRTGTHDGYERIVFEFRPHAPVYRADYLRGPAIACGSGDTVAVEGKHVFAISFSGADAHEFNGEEARSSIPERVLRPRYAGILEAKLTCDFEAEVAWAIGVSDRLPFRVTKPDARRVAVDFLRDSTRR